MRPDTGRSGRRSVAALAVLGALALAGCASQPAAALHTSRFRLGHEQLALRYEVPPSALRPTDITLDVRPAAAAAVRVVATMTDMSMPPVRLTLRRSALGVYGGRMVLSMGGPWLYTIQVRIGSRTTTRRIRVWANG